MHLVQKAQHECVSSDFDMLLSLLLQWAVKEMICSLLFWVGRELYVLYFNEWVEFIPLHSECKCSIHVLKMLIFPNKI